MPIIAIDQLSVAFGERRILDRVDLNIRAGERVCLIGRNGEGKSTLLGIISGRVEPDDGECWIRPGHRVGILEQDASADESLSVHANVTAGVAQAGEILSAYHEALRVVGDAQDRAALARLAEAQHRLEASGGWELNQRIDELLSRLELDPDARLGTLSGGWRRRAMLARALIAQPDLLLLDEPTNHLDIEAITWLENFMLDYSGALLFVSHDRALAKRLATRVVELDRGKLMSWPGNIDNFLRKKAQALAAEEKANAEFDKRLSKEEAWIRQGIKARRTRNEGRVRALKAMREERRARREQIGQAKLQTLDADTSGKIVVATLNANAGYGDTTVIREVTLTLMRKDRVGIVGPNGCGKSTLLKLLLGKIEPQSGSVQLGAKLDTAYFDQQRERLDPQKSVLDNVNDGSEYINVRGRRRHVAGYLREFLFPSERFDSPVATLSGGERNRLLLAKILARPANLLVLDEPTNDLDVETLELLEDLLTRYEGTLLLVSHDREFLDNVVTSIVHLDASGRAHEFVGGYSDFARQYQPDRERSSAASGATKHTRTPSTQRKQSASERLSYREKREFEALPASIDALEAEQRALEEEISATDFYASDHRHVREKLERLKSVVSELDSLYARWDELDGRN